MPAIVEKFFGQPIAIAILKGHISLRDMEKIYAETLSFFSDSSAPCLYQITDARHADFSLPETLKILSSVTQIIHTCNQAQIKFIFLGTPGWKNMVQGVLAQQALAELNDTVSLTLFSEMSEALYYIREQSAPANIS